MNTIIEYKLRARCRLIYACSLFIVHTSYALILWPKQNYKRVPKIKTVVGFDDKNSVWFVQFIIYCYREQMCDLNKKAK